MATRKLFNAADRNCLHVEIDIGGSNMSHETGDHVAIWPMSSNEEVNRCIDVLGLAEKRNAVINIAPLDLTAKAPFFSTTTYDALFRYYLDICGPLSCQLVATLATFSTDERTPSEMVKLGSDKAYFHQHSDARFFTISQFLYLVSNGQKWTNIPLSAWIEGCPSYSLSITPFLHLLSPSPRPSPQQMLSRRSRFPVKATSSSA